LVALPAILLAGCQTYTTSTLPEPRYLEHPPQYFPPSPMFPLSKELAYQERVAAQPPVAVQPQPVQPAPGDPLIGGPPIRPVRTTNAAPTITVAVPVQSTPPRDPRQEVKDPYVADLLDVISQTKSVDAFLVTVSLLADARAEPRQVLPTVIRNAERLGIYGRYAFDDEARGAEVAKQLTELLGHMARGKAGSDRKKDVPPTVSYSPAAQTLPQTEPTEEKFQKADYRTPIRPPVVEGKSMPLCEDPPTDAEVLRALPHVKRGVPYVSEEFREDIRIVTELVKDTIDPPRFFPLVGPARLHHCHYKCTVYFDEVIESSYPFGFKVKKPRTEVVYIDKDHLHVVEASPATMPPAEE
jgi:hypothetical protein